MKDLPQLILETFNEEELALIKEMVEDASFSFQEISDKRVDEGGLLY